MAERAVSPATGTMRWVVVEARTYDLHPEAAAYLASLRARGCSPNTERVYAGRLALYLNYCRMQRLDWTRQKVALACALVHRPTVLVLDEPSNSLDPSAVVRLREIITGIAGRGGAVLVSSHHLDELARLADTVTVLHRGRIVGGLDPRGLDLEHAFFDLIYQADQDQVREAE